MPGLLPGRDNKPSKPRHCGFPAIGVNVNMFGPRRSHDFRGKRDYPFGGRSGTIDDRNIAK